MRWLLAMVAMVGCGAAQEPSQPGSDKETEARAIAMPRIGCDAAELDSVHVEDLQGFELPVYSFTGCGRTVHVACDDDECAPARPSCPVPHELRDDGLRIRSEPLQLQPRGEDRARIDLAESDTTYELEDSSCFWLLDE